MLGFLLTLLIITAVICGVTGGVTQSVTSAAASAAEQAIYLCISIGGSMALWGGLLKIAETAGVTRFVTRIVGKPIARLMGKSSDDELTRTVSLGAALNLLGLGNAAVPTAIKAMKQLDREEGCSGRGTAFFIILNTASIQLLPVTAAAMRTRHGSEAPWEIMPASLLTSAAALTVGLLTAAVIFPKARGSKAQ